jgi:hypothetical protein
MSAQRAAFTLLGVAIRVGIGKPIPVLRFGIGLMLFVTEQNRASQN